VNSREAGARALLQLARVVNAGIDKDSESALHALVDLDTELRQFFDSLSTQEPVTPAELSILEDVGAILNRAKTLAATQRSSVLAELKGLRNSRSGIEAYQAADATN